MSKFDRADPGLSPEYCDALSIDIEDERADEARDARDRADEAEAEAAAAQAREMKPFPKPQTPAA